MKNDRLIKKLLDEGRFNIDLDKGIVKNQKGQVLGQYDEHNGYIRTRVKHNKKIRRLAIHRIIWISVYGVPKYGTIINHKDTIKLHNWVDNLEKNTHAQNTRHAVANGCWNTKNNHNVRSATGKFMATIFYHETIK